MSIVGKTDWQKLPVTLGELCINTTLRCGQSFRWQKINHEWTCTLHGRLLHLKQDSTHLHYKVTFPAPKPKTPEPKDTESLLRHYFNLDTGLEALYKQWSEADSNFRKRAPQFQGVRILRQDAWETLICFICSSNNNIARISQMVHKLCLHYGPLIAYMGDEAFHDFPSPQALTGDGVETHLRALGFGYRAKYIAETAKIVAQEKPSNWLESLRNPEQPGFNTTPVPKEQHATYKEAQEQLLTLKGVGPKVADCVCLMGLGWGEAVPVDTHVWQIAQRDYMFSKSKAKTLNKATYDAVGDHFRNLWGSYAGWAHSVLFTADLREFAAQAAKEEDEPTVIKIGYRTSEDGTRKDVKKTITITDSNTEVKEEKSEVVVPKLEEGTEESKQLRRSKRQRTS
ncbi:8-oxoguanine glycosylase ogg1 [Fusarium equiseti]|uniref:DNA-(apurinic or apyrimidinic site) lyase n=1 Tax=Fusarium equiseti TaxID=61235 RepID=A0ABQ8RSD5_FUSEQ|nr:8-oxoguanine glycosylase ogg1 [Fusarium equiseti]